MAPARFPYVNRAPALGEAGFAPIAPLTLTVNSISIQALGLLDTGASANVLPYSVGLQLGLVWERQNIPIQLAGNLAAVPSRAALVLASIGGFTPVQLAFAWIQTDNAPLLLGQINFFMEFDVCFFRSELAFEVVPKQTNSSSRGTTAPLGRP
jgi:hypothetical protein